MSVGKRGSNLSNIIREEQTHWNIVFSARKAGNDRTRPYDTKASTYLIVAQIKIAKVRKQGQDIRGQRPIQSAATKARRHHADVNKEAFDKALKCSATTGDKTCPTKIIENRKQQTQSTKRERVVPVPCEPELSNRRQCPQLGRNRLNLPNHKSGNNQSWES